MLGRLYGDIDLLFYVNYVRYYLLDLYYSLIWYVMEYGSTVLLIIAAQTISIKYVYK